MRELGQLHVKRAVMQREALEATTLERCLGLGAHIVRQAFLAGRVGVAKGLVQEVVALGLEALEGAREDLGEVLREGLARGELHGDRPESLDQPLAAKDALENLVPAAVDQSLGGPRDGIEAV